MGLDMYLEAEAYVSDYEFQQQDGKTTPAGVAFRDLVKTFEMDDFIDPHTPSAHVKFNVAYWRKANQIHKWFVDNVQGGVDDCNPHYVERSQLTDLLRLCEQVLASTHLEDGEVKNGQRLTKEGWEDIIEDGQVMTEPTVAQELLPTESGFFFGSTEYDQWYMDDLKSTVEQLTRALSMPDDNGPGLYGWSFYYRSSW